MVREQLRHESPRVHDCAGRVALGTKVCGVSTAFVDTLQASARGPMLLVGTQRARQVLSAGAARSAWSVSEGPMFLGHIVQHMVLDRATSARCSWRAHRPPRTDRVPLDRPRRDVDRGEEATRVRNRRPVAAQPERGVLAHARTTRASPASGTRAARRRACSAPKTAATPGSRCRAWNDHPMWETWCEWPGGEHARRLDAALGDRRSARRRPPVHRPLRRRRVREHRRRHRLAAAQRRLPRDVRPTPSPSSATTRTACACTRCGPTGCTSRTTAASTAWSARRDVAAHRRQHAARRRRHRVPDRAAPARPRHRLGVPDGRHRRVARAPAPTGSRPRTSRATRASRGRGSAPDCPSARGSP